MQFFHMFAMLFIRGKLRSALDAFAVVEWTPRLEMRLQLIRPFLIALVATLNTVDFVHSLVFFLVFLERLKFQERN